MPNRPAWPAVPEPVPTLHHRPRRVTPLWARVVDEHVERYPMAVAHATTPRDGAHVVVDATQPTGRAAEMADVLVREAPGAPADWARRAFERLPGLTVAAVIEADTCRMWLRDGTEHVRRAAPGEDPAVLASVLYDEVVRDAASRRS